VSVTSLTPRPNSSRVSFQNFLLQYLSRRLQLHCAAGTHTLLPFDILLRLGAWQLCWEKVSPSVLVGLIVRRGEVSLHSSIGVVRNIHMTSDSLTCVCHDEVLSILFHGDGENELCVILPSKQRE
jgi:hypothetical protein